MTTIPSTNILLDAALAYAQRGWYVVALHSITSGSGCTCNQPTCDSPGKHPRYDRQLLPNGLKNSTVDPGIIQVWWSLWPDANVGIVTGAASGLWALDIDPDKGGDLSLEQLLQQHGPLPDTGEAATGGGGRHILFAHPGTPIRNRVRFAPGLDTRGDGGYIVATPSLHASGRRYAWQLAPDNTPLALAPQWLLDLVTAPAAQAQPAPTASTNGHAPLPSRTLQYVVFGASNGTRNSELYAAAQQFYAAGYSQQEADQRLRSRAQQDGLDDLEIDKTIGSAYQSTFVSGPAAPPGSGSTAAPAGSSAGASPATQGATQSSPSRQQRQHSTYIAQALQSLGYVFRLNLCNDTIEVNGEPITDVIAARIRMDARDMGLKPLGAVEDTYMIEAAANAYHPIRDYLNGLQWDGQLHIARLAAKFQDSDPPIVYTDGSTRTLFHVYLWRWLIGAVAKAMLGTQNMMLVLAGPQGIGKSNFAKWLCLHILAYFLEAPINVGDKDTYVRLISRFIWEVSELDATTRKADVAALKAFITEEQVTVRKAYGRHDTVKPALASLIGTVNQSTGFLSDDTGNRRFLVATLETIDWSYTQLDVDQIWAEAVAAYRRGEPWQLLPNEAAMQAQQNKQHETETILRDWIANYFYVGPAAGTARMTAGEIIDLLRTRYDIRLTGTERAQAMELARVLKHLGAIPVRTSSWRGYEGVLPR